MLTVFLSRFLIFQKTRIWNSRSMICSARNITDLWRLTGQLASALLYFISSALSLFPSISFLSQLSEQKNSTASFQLKKELIFTLGNNMIGVAAIQCYIS